MKILPQSRSLRVAIAASLLLHGALLAVKFVAAPAAAATPISSGLEIILVNAKRTKPPLTAQALAQANLDGGGRETDGRAKSPLPELASSEDVLHLKSANVAPPQSALVQKPVIQMNDGWRASTRLTLAKPDDSAVSRAGVESINSLDALKQREAEISRRIEDRSRQPLKTQITPSTRAVGYAQYYADLQHRVETVGTRVFPQHRGRKLYGDLIVSIPLFQDGTIYEHDGGIKIERSSGNTNLDAAAVKIVRLAAPFGPFPKQMRSAGRDDVWEVITRFKFARGDVLEATMGGN